MNTRLLLFAFLLISNLAFAQDYVSYFAGNETNVDVEPTFGVCLMGGASENDEAMKWFLNRANGGDILVLRTSGSDGYNDYFYSDLGVTVNSVETILILNDLGATNPYVLDKVANAEAIWFAGGDQYDYVTYFKDNQMETALQNHISVKQGVIGGTSAGMAILGEHYFDAANGTITSEEAILNPYNPKVSIGSSDFLNIPYLENTITDTHYDAPDRRGRQTTFMARIIEDQNVRALGVASEEYTAICIDENGIASAYGSFPEFEDYVYFVQPNCEDFNADQCLPDQPLLWTEGVKVYKVPATNDGIEVMDMNTWEPLTDTAEWLQWSLENGDTSVSVFTSEDPMCYNLSVNEVSNIFFTITPNPTTEFISIQGTTSQVEYSIFNLQGSVVQQGTFLHAPISTQGLTSGVYFVKIKQDDAISFLRFIKK